MLPVSLTKIKTRDHVVLEGIAVLPKRPSDTALIWVHGLSSSFQRGQTLIRVLSQACAKNRIGYFKFNNRGHDIVARSDKKCIGAGFECFEDSLEDIRAMIRFAKKLGFKKIILAGHSTGANKVLYYMYKTRDRMVTKLALLGPVSDIAGEIKKIGQNELHKRVNTAEKIAKKNPQGFVPREYGIYTAERFLSLYRSGSAEDVFPHYEAKPHSDRKWKELKSVHVPIVVIFGSRDEYLDRPAKKLVEQFRGKAISTKSFTGVMIAGANHGFRRKEEILTEELMKFVKTKPI